MSITSIVSVLSDVFFLVSLNCLKYCVSKKPIAAWHVPQLHKLKMLSPNQRKPSLIILSSYNFQNFTWYLEACFVGATIKVKKHSIRYSISNLVVKRHSINVVIYTPPSYIYIYNNTRYRSLHKIRWIHDLISWYDLKNCYYHLVASLTDTLK